MSKEIPVLFNGEMVRAIKAGRKTQTRRPMKVQPPEEIAQLIVGSYNPTKIDRHGEEYPGEEIYGAYSSDGEWGWKSPFGKPGDVLLVKEGYQIKDCLVDRTVRGQYLMDNKRFEVQLTGLEWSRFRKRKKPHAVTSGRYMYKSLCRLHLTVKRVWVEHIQDISEMDAIAEGIESVIPTMVIDDGPGGLIWFDGREIPKWAKRCDNGHHPSDAFADVWDSIYGPGAWDRNDMVFACEFEAKQ